MPFDNVHSVIPIASYFLSPTTLPAVGTVATSAPAATVSLHAAMLDAATVRNTLRTCASVGGVSPAFSGIVTVTTRFDAPDRSLPSAFTAARVIFGSRRFAASYSNAMPGIPSPDK